MTGYLVWVASEGQGGPGGFDIETSAETQKNAWLIMLEPETDGQVEPQRLPQLAGALKARMCQLFCAVGAVTVSAGSGKEAAGC
jgi:hypothetical protein